MARSVQPTLKLEERIAKETCLRSQQCASGSPGKPGSNHCTGGPVFPGTRHFFGQVVWVGEGSFGVKTVTEVSFTLTDTVCSVLENSFGKPYNQKCFLSFIAPLPSPHPTVDRKSSQTLLRVLEKYVCKCNWQGEIQGCIPCVPSPGKMLASEVEPGLAAYTQEQ